MIAWARAILSIGGGPHSLDCWATANNTAIEDPLQGQGHRAAADSKPQCESSDVVKPADAARLAS